MLECKKVWRKSQISVNINECIQTKKTQTRAIMNILIINTPALPAYKERMNLSINRQLMDG